MSIWKSSTRAENEGENNAASGYTQREAEFLPALLEVQERPSAPYARALLYTITLLFAFAAVWSRYAMLDIVVETPGTLRPVDETQPIQAAIAGKIAAIHVSPGQRVAAGDILIELDDEAVVAERNRIATARDTALLTSASARALLQKLEGQDDDPLSQFAATDELAGIDSAMLAETRLRLASQLREIDARNARAQAQAGTIEAAIASQEAERQRRFDERSAIDVQAQVAFDALQAEIDGLEQALQMQAIEEDRSSKLYERGIISASDHNKEQMASHDIAMRVGLARSRLALKQAEINDQEQRLDDAVAAAGDQLVELRAELSRMRQEHGAEVAEAASAAALAWTEARAQLRELQLEIIKQDEFLAHHRISAPHAGIAEQLAVRQAGAVVQAAQVLLLIVPVDAHLRAEVLIANQDLGYLEPGQDVKIKLDAFPHTEHGLLSGKLVDIAADAVEMEELGIVYPARIEIERQDIELKNGQTVPLAAGMGLTAEIKTGERPLYEYFLDPLLRHSDKALDER
ncbi:MAG: HlyD family efflux transporter periplasmic adaptor subunit [Betaproteobacteria bacterium AqS2]|uniref:HlyD family efflux transporter periplasmic adaptor subunit n=1 Tax=Candidatus Amphirhobacter heronislandensis TaxID=1732024 RepID=A0A930UGM7_9GAMM|nr:HlyD family efflux transporter periplasmic adaptor subunit [Betaproteobacteria bacterium AqS2]